MQARYLPVASSIICLLLCCASPVTLRDELPPFGIRVGVLGDTQYTTRHETFQHTGFRNSGSDRFVDVSLRPPALEKLSRSLLRKLLDDLAESRVDVILYLGDAANSGCKEELDGAFQTLREARAQHGIPIYFAIGNHDYLGTGNQTLRRAKLELCGDVHRASVPENAALDKAEVIKIMHDFNMESAKLDKLFTYEWGPEGALASYTRAPSCDNSHYLRYYVGALKAQSRSGAHIRVLLADTSDYNNVWFRPTLKWADKCEILGGWGLKGSMSSDQIWDLRGLGKPDVKKDTAWEEVADYNIVASHYDPLAFNIWWKWEYSPSFVKDNLGFLLTTGENLWLAAHRHSEAPRTFRVPVGGLTKLSGPQGTFHGFGVGSTTDFLPHAAIVEEKTWINSGISPRVGYRTIRAPAIGETCSQELYDHIERTRTKLRPVKCSDSAPPNANIDDMLGLTRIYEQPECWDRTAYETISTNIETVLRELNERDRREAEICLALLASYNEKRIKID